MNKTNVAGSPLSDEEMTALVLAVQLLTTPARAEVSPTDDTPAWRFSGRWFSNARRFD